MSHRLPVCAAGASRRGKLEEVPATRSFVSKLARSTPGPAVRRGEASEGAEPTAAPRWRGWAHARNDNPSRRQPQCEVRVLLRRVAPMTWSAVHAPSSSLPENRSSHAAAGHQRRPARPRATLSQPSNFPGSCSGCRARGFSRSFSALVGLRAVANSCPSTTDGFPGPGRQSHAPARPVPWEIRSAGPAPPLELRPKTSVDVRETLRDLASPLKAAVPISSAPSHPPFHRLVGVGHGSWSAGRPPPAFPP